MGQMMIDKNDLVALVELLNRIPMSMAEKLWTQTLIRKLESLLVVNRSEGGGGTK